MPAYALRWSLDKDAEIGFSSPRTEHMELGEKVYGLDRRRSFRSGHSVCLFANLVYINSTIHPIVDGVYTAGLKKKSLFPGNTRYGNC